MPARQIVVERQDVEAAFVQTAQSFVRTGCMLDDKTQPAKLLLDEARQRMVVVDVQDLG